MSRHPRIGSSEYIKEEPRRIHVYNGNYDSQNNFAGSTNKPWGVYRSFIGLGDFETFPEAIAEAQRLTAKR